MTNKCKRCRREVPQCQKLCLSCEREIQLSSNEIKCEKIGGDVEVSNNAIFQPNIDNIASSSSFTYKDMKNG